MRKQTVKVKPAAFPAAQARAETHGELIATVYHLVDCFQRAFGGKTGEEARHYQNAAQAALAATLAAERRIADLTDRIAQMEKTGPGLQPAPLAPPLRRRA